SGNRWMRYEDGGESLENVVKSGGGGDGGLKGYSKVRRTLGKTTTLSAFSALGLRHGYR
ncbi:hypothetical protein Tco_0824999, partial [Tanacetum coccineum]